MACFSWKEEPGGVRPPGQLSTLILGVWQVASSQSWHRNIILGLPAKSSMSRSYPTDQIQVCWQVYLFLASTGGPTWPCFVLIKNNSSVISQGHKNAPHPGTLHVPLDPTHMCRLSCPSLHTDISR